MENIVVDKVMLSDVNDTYIAPNFKEVRHNNVVAYGNSGSGSKAGDYPDKLIGLFQNSTLHSCIIKGKVNQIIGGGYSINAITGTTEYDSTKSFIDNVNNDNETLEELSLKIGLDKKIFGGYATLLTFSRDWSKIVELQHIPFDKLRCEKYDVNGKINHWYYSRDWSTQKALKQEFEVVNFTEIQDKAIQYKEALAKNDLDTISKLSCNYNRIYIGVEYTAGRDYYPLPSYVAAINSINASAQVDVFFNNTMKSGMRADGMLITIGDGSTETNDSDANVIRRAYTGAGNAGELMVATVKDKDTVPQYVAFPAKAQDGLVEQLIDETTNRILSAHGITSPLLLGIKTEGQLGGGTELQEAEEIMYQNTIKPDQIQISKYINKVMKFNEMSDVYLTRLKYTSTSEAAVTSEEFKK